MNTLALQLKGITQFVLQLYPGKYNFPGESVFNFSAKAFKHTGVSSLTTLSVSRLLCKSVKIFFNRGI